MRPIPFWNPRYVGSGLGVRTGVRTRLHDGRCSRLNIHCGSSAISHGKACYIASGDEPSLQEFADDPGEMLGCTLPGSALFGIAPVVQTNHGAGHLRMLVSSPGSWLEISGYDVLSPIFLSKTPGFFFSEGNQSVARWASTRGGFPPRKRVAASGEKEPSARRSIERCFLVP